MRYLIVPIGCSCAGKTYLYENLIKTEQSVWISNDFFYRKLFEKKINNDYLIEEERIIIIDFLINKIQEQLDDPKKNIIYCDSTAFSEKKIRQKIFNKLNIPQEIKIIFINFNNIPFKKILENQEKRFFNMINKHNLLDTDVIRKQFGFMSEEKLLKLYFSVEPVSYQEFEKNIFNNNIFIFNIGDNND